MLHLLSEAKLLKKTITWLSIIKNELSIFFSINLRRNRVNNKAAKRCLKKYNGDLLSLNNLEPRKSSNTLFIIGAGSSINKLSRAQITAILASDSIAITHLCHHDELIPTFYSLELWDVNELSTMPLEKRALNNFILNKLIKKSDRYQETTFIIKPRVSFQSNFDDFLRLIPKKNVFWSQNYQIPGGSTAGFRHWLRFYKRLFLFESEDKFYFKAASLIWCLMFAYKLRYEKVVLLGVDLIGPYFYEGDTRASNEVIHNTADAGRVHDGVTVQEIIKVVYDELFSPRGTELLVQRECFLLAAQFRSWSES